MDHKEGLELLKESIENITCRGVECEKCPLDNKTTSCELVKFKKMSRKELCCSECGRNY